MHVGVGFIFMVLSAIGYTVGLNLVSYFYHHSFGPGKRKAKRANLADWPAIHGDCQLVPSRRNDAEVGAKACRVVDFWLHLRCALEHHCDLSLMPP
jgi:hypothetical protein